MVDLHGARFSMRAEHSSDGIADDAASPSARTPSTHVASSKSKEILVFIGLFLCATCCLSFDQLATRSASADRAQHPSRQDVPQFPIPASRNEHRSAWPRH